jgi:organic hydroperoxide reductase OsmC/OhrA
MDTIKPLRHSERRTHEKICPYSHATRGNVDVQVEGA